MKPQLIILSAFLAVMTAHAQDEDTSLITYQGKLVRGGHLVSTNLPMTFAIYDAQQDGQVLFSESQMVAVVDGFYTVKFGANPTQGDLEEAAIASTAYLQVTVDGEVMKPREKFVPPPFAKKATERWNILGDPNWVGKTVHLLLQLARIATPFGVPGTGDICLFPPAGRKVTVVSAKIKLVTPNSGTTVWTTNGYFTLEVRDCSSGIVGDVLHPVSERLYRPPDWTLNSWVTFTLSTNKSNRILQPDDYLCLRLNNTNDLHGAIMMDVRVK